MLRASRPLQTQMDHRTIHLQVVGGTSALPEATAASDSNMPLLMQA